MPARVFGSGRRNGEWPRVLALSCLLVPSFTSPAAAQTCMGLAPSPNGPEIALRVSRQEQGYRVGGRAAANVAGVLGVEAGAAGGKIDQFASNGSEVGGLFWISPLRTSPSTCFFAEYVQSEEDFENAFDLDRGTLRERWLWFGFGLGIPLGEIGGSRFSVHAAPEVIARKANLNGRTLHVDTTLFVLETKKQNFSTHLGGRCVFSVRRERGAVVLFLRTRPRFGSDLEWGVQVSLPI